MESSRWIITVVRIHRGSLLGTLDGTCSAAASLPLLVVCRTMAWDGIRVPKDLGSDKFVNEKFEVYKFLQLIISAIQFRRLMIIQRSITSQYQP